MSSLSNWLDDVAGPHGGQPLLAAGAELAGASAAVIMLHGRGASASGILDLAGLLGAPGVAFLAPQATGGAWYPYRFLEARDVNEPGLSSAHAVVGMILDKLNDAGIETAQIVLLGFSQGACLATDYAALNPRRYGGVIGFSGGLIGDRIDPGAYAGSLAGTPAFLGCSDVDAHIPVERVHETARVFEILGADLTTAIYPGMGHTINQDEIEHARRIIGRTAEPESS